MNKIIALLVLAFTISEAGASEARLKKATGVYKQFCSHCHGIGMVNPGTSSYDLRQWPTNEKDRFYEVVKDGVGDMPAWGDILTQEELDDLWYYVATRAGKQPFPEKSSQKKNDTSAPGDITAGKASDTWSTMEGKKFKVCLARNGGIMSEKRHNGGTGFDYELSKSIADQLGLELAVTWFEAELDEYSDPVKETYAMLALGLCDAVPGFSLYETSLGPFTGERAAPPRWDEQPSGLPKGFQVDLEPIAVSKPYVRIEFGIVVHQNSKAEFSKISDMSDHVVGIEQGTLTEFLTLQHGTSAMKKKARTFNPGPSFLWHMENGKFEAALVSIPAFDFHKRKNRVTQLRLTGFRHTLGFNIAFAILAKNKPLADKISHIINSMSEKSLLQKIATHQGMNYAAPRRPYIQPRFRLTDMSKSH